MIVIRDAEIRDLVAITEIYNEAILNTTATLDTKVKSIEERKNWLSKHNHRYPVIVAEEKGVINGWASLNSWSDKEGYSYTAEASLYIKKGHRGEGLGKKLTEAILQRGKEAGLHTVIARMVEDSRTSIHILEDFGFTHVGIMKESGKKFGKFFDVYIMQKIFN